LGGGKSARHLIELLKPFDAHIVLWVRYPGKHRDLLGQVEFIDLESVFQTYEVISLNLALNDQTQRLITKNHIVSLPIDAILVNCARLELIDRFDLAEAFSRRPDLRVGIDATALSASCLFHTLKDRALFSPHIAGLTAETSQKMDNYVVERIKKVFGIRI
jgi:D-3-phosphoglycerate dehydrogenase